MSGLRIVFDIEKTSSSNANNAKIQIYNLNESNRGILKTGENLSITLEIGYGDILEQLFIGDIQRSFTQRSGPDFITTIEADDGGRALSESKLDKSYSAGVKLKSVVDDAMQSMKDAGQIIIGSVSNIKDEIAQNGITISGLAQKIINDIANKQGLEFSVQDNEAQILDPAIDTGEIAVLLTPNTGLIGSPNLGIAGENIEGIEFKALIQTTKFRPGRAVKIESKDFNGLIRINKSKFIGDTHAPSWFVIGEGNIL
ncbi:hypothetical protein KAR91_15445 [Candidatus Pacearchaeota archaeon]|nr:hypothetical protein [Candidatus Pacearchaeota archaeon]